MNTPRRTAIIFDAVFERHETGNHHPERPARVRAIMDALTATAESESFTRLAPRPASPEEIALVHPPARLDAFLQACRTGQPYFDDPECPLSPGTADAALHAAGAPLVAADEIAAGRIDNAFCVVRPPGHHAEPNRGMGFCYFNNVAIAARYLQKHHGVERIAIVDWDLHHGNGTQAAFYTDPSVFFVSLHEHPAYRYPGTGYAHETGQGAGEGTTLNLPMPPGSGDAEYRRAFTDRVIPAIREFEPGFLLISAGFDAHLRDPLGTIELSDHAFVWMTQQMLRLADECCRGRLLSVLEGGYDLAALARCAALHALVLHTGHADPDALTPASAAPG